MTDIKASNGAEINRATLDMESLVRACRNPLDLSMSVTEYKHVKHVDLKVLACVYRLERRSWKQVLKIAS